MLEEEDVACAVDDIKTTDCSRSFVQRRRENRGSEYELMVYLGERLKEGRTRVQGTIRWCPRCRRRKAVGPTRQDIDVQVTVGV
jgi:hypothetical protein